MAAGCTEYSLNEELELLEAIYIHELSIEGKSERPDSLSVLLHPSTGDEEHKQYVCLTLVIHLTEEYPESCPSLSIKSPRGLSEAHVSSILSNLRELAESRLGGPMLYELIEYAKESLTDNNIPSCACTICLSHFQDSDNFTRTDCYHYFHCSCLLRFIQFSLQAKDTEDGNAKEVECPVCRLPVSFDLTALQGSSVAEPASEEEPYVADETMKKLQQEMAALYEKQLKKGGIIDIEQERLRFLIDTSSAKSASSNADPETRETSADAKPAEALAEPVRPDKQGKREAQDRRRRGGSGNKHKQGGRKAAAGPTRREGAGKGGAVAPVDSRKSRGRESERRGEVSGDGDSSATALKSRNRAEVKSCAKGDNPSDQRADSASVRGELTGKSESRNGGGPRANARGLAGQRSSAERPSKSRATNQKIPRPPPGFQQLPGESHIARTSVNPPPGFEGGSNRSGGRNSKKCMT